MGTFSITKDLETNNLSEEKIFTSFEKLLPSYFDKIKTSIENEKKIVYCRKKSPILNPIVSIKATATTKIKENVTTVMIIAQTKTNGWFWFTTFLGCWSVKVFLWKA